MQILIFSKYSLIYLYIFLKSAMVELQFPLFYLLYIEFLMILKYPLKYYFLKLSFQCFSFITCFSCNNIRCISHLRWTDQCRCFISSNFYDMVTIGWLVKFRERIFESFLHINMRYIKTSISLNITV